MRCYKLLRYQTSLWARHEERLPAIGVDDFRRSVDRLITRVISVRARREIAELVGSVVMTKREDRCRRRVANPHCSRDVGGTVARIKSELPHRAIEDGLLGRKEVH